MAEPLTTEPFIVRYRPREWEEFVGNEAVVKSVREALDNSRSRAFLFHGGSGFGKTTLARLCAYHLGVKEGGIIEIDGATYTSIENMREITDGLKYRAWTSKVIIVDEAHALSRQAIQSVLKAIEEPPSLVHWFLCTTMPSRIPETIKTRCSVHELKALSTAQLRELLDAVVYAERAEVPANIVDLCVNEAYGSARRALAYLAQTIHCATREEAASIIGRVAVDSDKTFALAVALWNKEKWSVVQRLLEEVKDEDPESIRHKVRALATTNILKFTDPKEVCAYMPLLDEFLSPMDRSNGISEVLSACSRWLFR